MRKRILISVFFAALTFCAAFFGWFGGAEQFAEDILCHRTSGANNNIRIVAIDEKTISRFGEYSSWDRSVYAQLIETLCVSEQVRPAVIGFDVLFGSEGNSVSDERFARACEEHGAVVCAFSYIFSRELTADSEGQFALDTLSVADRVLPYKALYDVTEHGFVNAIMDKNDGAIRRAMLRFNDGGKTEYSFNATVYETYMRTKGAVPEFPKTSESGVYKFRYSGKCGEFETVSLCDVLDGTVPAQAFSGCVVLVGAAAKGMMDAFSVPVEKGDQMYGVEIHANIIQALMEGKFVETAPRLPVAVIAALLIGVAAFVCAGASVGAAWIVCLSLAAVRLIVSAVLFSNGVAADILPVPAGAFLLAVFCTMLHYYVARRSKAQIERAFKKYVAPQVVSEIAKSGRYEVKLSGENRDIAVLFVDIRGFTSLSESIEPEQTVEMLNSYLKLTTSCIFRHGGTLDKFIGDATMAVFNSPFDLDDYVYKAVLTAWDIVKGGEELSAEFAAKYGRSVGFGVGVNCGRAVVGNIGCDFRMDYTAIGDTVNTSARLEANAPAGKIYISEAVYERVSDRITVDEVGEIPLKGKQNGVFVYSVTGMTENTEKEAEK